MNLRLLFGVAVARGKEARPILPQPPVSPKPLNPEHQANSKSQEAQRLLELEKSFDAESVADDAKETGSEKDLWIRV